MPFLTSKQWLVFLVASAAWLFDCLDQRLFTLARSQAVAALAAANTSPADLQATGKMVTAVFLVGWGVGGMIFGALGDRYGRVRMLSLTILLYSGFTGLTFFSTTNAEFATYRFLTGLGVGGVFGVAVALVAETMPDAARAPALAMLQILSAIGNISAALLKNLFDSLERAGVITESWRWMFLAGAAPAALVLLTTRRMREPESWLQLQREGRLPTGGLADPYLQLLRDKTYRKNLAVGVTLASAGVVGLWAIGEYAVDLQRLVFHAALTAEGLPAAEVTRRVNATIANSYILNVLGAVAGMWAFARLAHARGRRAAFACGFAAAFVVTIATYWKMSAPWHAYIFMPLLGAAQLSVFAGFAIYLPELFPARLRSTGVSFCYNFGRFIAAAGSLVSARLATSLYGDFGSPRMERYSAMTMCAIFLIGLAILPFAPETRGKPLPES